MICLAARSQAMQIAVGLGGFCLAACSQAMQIAVGLGGLGGSCPTSSTPADMRLAASSQCPPPPPPQSPKGIALHPGATKDWGFITLGVAFGIHYYKDPTI